MFSVFLELVKRAGIFVIIGQTIQHFGISQKYEKYMKLVISFMIAAQIIFAFGVYADRDEKSGMIMSVEEYMEEWDSKMEKVEEKIESNKIELTGNLKEELQQSELKEAGEETVTGSSIQIEKITIQ